MTEQLTRRERQNLKKAQRQEEQEAKEKTRESKQKKKTSLTLIVGSIVAIGMIVAFIMIFKGGKPYSEGQVHWHADLEIILCGKPYSLPTPSEGSLHGQAFLGEPLLHIHEDKRIHIEGTVQQPEDITLGKFMEAIGLTFKDDQLLDKKNGDNCDNTPGKIRLKANNKESTALSNQVIKDGDTYQLTFEP
jgi:hypothetical protein